MLDSMIFISSYEQSFAERLARLTEQILPFPSSAPTTLVAGNAKDWKIKMQTRSEINTRGTPRLICKPH